MVKLIDNGVDADSFINLRKGEPFVTYRKEDVEVALRNSLYTVLAEVDDKPVGMARVVGDGRIAFFIKDVVVIDGYKRQRIGTMIMDRVMDYIESVGCIDAYVGLMSTPHKEPFYEKLGFVRRPNKDHGAGMIMFIKRGRKE